MEKSGFRVQGMRGRGVGANLVVPPMLVQEGDDGLDVVLLDDVQHLRTLNQDTVQHLQDPCADSRVTGEGNVAPPAPVPIPSPGVLLPDEASSLSSLLTSQSRLVEKRAQLLRLPRIREAEGGKRGSDPMELRFWGP